MQNIEVTQFNNGLGTVRDNNLLVALPLPTIGSAAMSVEDFDAASNFANTYSQLALGGGAVQSQALNAAGVAIFTSAGGDDDGVKAHADANTTAVDSFQIALGVPAWMGMRFQLDDVVQSDFLMGFVPGADTLDPAPVDGIFLQKLDGLSAVSVVSVNSAGGTSTAVLGTIEADTWYEALLYWDGIANVSGQLIGPGGVVGGGNTIVPAANLPQDTVGLEPSFGFQAGEAAVKILSVDWVLFASGR